MTLSGSWDDFDHVTGTLSATISTSAGTLTTGSGSWGVIATTSAGSYTVKTGESGHPGILTLTTASTGDVRLYRGNIEATLPYLCSDFARLDVVARLGATPSGATTFSLGLINGSTTGIYFYFTTANSWHALCQSGGVSTDNNLSIAPDNAWHRYSILQASGIVTFYIDGVLVNTISTNVPTAGVNFRIALTSASGAAKAVDLDYISPFTSKALSR